MADVFISYSRKDKDFVRRLHDALVKQGREAWVDWEGIPPTSEFLEEIYRAIESAEVFVFVLSPDSVQSDVCRLEIEHAVADNKRLVPIVWRDVPAGQVHGRLAAIDWIFFRESDDFSGAFAKLIDALNTDLDWLKSHTRLLVRAREWQRQDQDRSLLLRGRDLKQVESRLAELGDKEPQPTALQQQFVAASATAARKARRRTLVGIGVGSVLAIVAVIIGLWMTAEQRVSSFMESDANAEQFDDNIGDLLQFPRYFVGSRLAARMERLVHASQGEMADGERLENGWRSADAAIALIHAGRMEDALRVFHVRENLEPSTQFVDRCSGRGVRAEELLRQLNTALVRRNKGEYGVVFGEHEVTVCYGLLLSLGHVLQAKPQDVDLRNVVSAYENDFSSGIHGACGWLLRVAGTDVDALDERIAAEHARWVGTSNWREKLRLRLDSVDSGLQNHEWFVLKLSQDGNSLCVTMVVFPAGVFRMGYPAPAKDDVFPGRFSHLEFPHEVTIVQPFAMSSEEFPAVQEGPAELPIEGQIPVLNGFNASIAWPQAAEICNAMTQALASRYAMDLSVWYLEDAGDIWNFGSDANGFRLPTQAEWEYACRSGTHTHYSFGSDEGVLGNYGQFSAAGDQEDLDEARLGHLLPNCRGLFDMHGGRSEWTHDPKRDYPEPTKSRGPLRDPGRAIARMDLQREQCVSRGGSHGKSAVNCRSASRESDAPQGGFRLCLPLQ